MDSIIIAAIITGASTIVSTIIGCLTANHVHKNKIKQNVKGDNNNASVSVRE